MSRVQTAPQDRVATLAVDAELAGLGGIAMGHPHHGLHLWHGQRADSRRRPCLLRDGQDGLFFRRAAIFNRKRVPGRALAMQCL